MTKLGLIDEAGVASVREQAQRAMRLAADALVEQDPDAKPGVRRIRPDLWPDPAFVDVGIRGDLSELADARTVEQRDFTGELKRGKLIDAVAGVMDRRMGEDPRIVVLGEDVHRLNGGTNGATKGLAKKYPGRVLGTPISENAFAGLGGGLALDGRFRPVVEFMYPDFLWVAADQVFNQIGKAHHMFGGLNPVPLVLRTKVALGSGYGSQHLINPGHLRHQPRLADYGRLDPVRLRGPDERGARDRRPGAHARACRPLRRRGRDPGRRPRLPDHLRHRPPCGARAKTSRCSRISRWSSTHGRR